MSSTREKAIKRLKKLSYFNDVLGKDYELTDEEQRNVEEFFYHYGFKDRDGKWRRIVCDWIRYGVSENWIERRPRLEELGCRMIEEYFILRYGEVEGKIRYHKSSDARTKHWTNRISHWTEQGYTEEQAKEKVSQRQRKVAESAPSTLKIEGSVPGHVKFWTNRGYTEEEAKAKISKMNTRDLSFFHEKYGMELGTKKYNETIAKKKNTWSSKTPLELMEHGKKTAPKNFNPDGLEMKVIREFMEVNDISPPYCKFGAQHEQFWQYIPEWGYRRYDLAVFSDLAHTKLEMIVEFHGMGHIDFSDFHESMRDEIFKVGGKELSCLKITYGEAHDNDKMKRLHIETEFPGTKYVVIWPEDYKLKRLKLDDLLRKRRN